MAVAEHLHAAGFGWSRTARGSCPTRFADRLPASAGLARAYLRPPLAWRVLGKQFLVVGER